jgi:uracil phosphoribosyltransferase
MRVRGPKWQAGRTGDRRRHARARMRCVTLTVIDHPLASDLLRRLRDSATGPAEFRALTRRLGTILVVEATRGLGSREVEVETPLETTTGRGLERGLVAIPVLRAGLGLLDSVTDLFPDTVVGYLGMERDEITLAPRDYYAKLPPMEERHALVLDPMLATGGSGSAACTYVKRASPAAIAFVCVVAAPEGVAKMAEDHPDVPIVTAALDRELNDKGFIMPGLGDFGDRLYGTAAEA